MHFDSGGTVYTVGVQSNATDLLNSTRQFISLGRWEGDHWTTVAKVSERDGYVYSPVAVPGGDAGLWIAWSEFNEIEQDFDIYARHWDGRRLGPVSRVGPGRGPDMRPSITLRADVRPWSPGSPPAGARSGLPSPAATEKPGTRDS